MKRGPGADGFPRSGPGIVGNGDSGETAPALITYLSSIQNVRELKKHVTIYTDGACSGNPGPGGWAAILVFGERERVISGFEQRTTNNRMELRAAVEALAALKEPCRVRLHTDSAYLHRAFTDGWLGRWQQTGWKTASKKPVENQDLWRRLLEVSREHDVEWVKVKGHASDEMNNRVDRLAVQAMRAQGVP